jgi:hypothetical protein
MDTLLYYHMQEGKALLVSNRQTNEFGLGLRQQVDSLLAGYNKATGVVIPSLKPLFKEYISLKEAYSKKITSLEKAKEKNEDETEQDLVQPEFMWPCHINNSNTIPKATFSYPSRPYGQHKNSNSEDEDADADLNLKKKKKTKALTAVINLTLR